MTNLYKDSAGIRQPACFLRLSIISIVAALLSLLVSCGGSDNTAVTQTGTENGTTNGVFVDDPVSLLNVESGGISGFTGAQGEFRCTRGEIVTFSIDKIVLGSTQCASVVTPLDLVPGADVDNPQVQAIASFLQSMDGDDDPGNGVITVSYEVHVWIAQAMAGQSHDQLNLTTMSPDDITAFTQTVVAMSQRDNSVNYHLVFVPPADAAANLEVNIARLGVFRRNVTNTPGLDTNDATLQVMNHVRIAPQRADSSNPSTCDSQANCVTPDVVNPLLVFYVEPPGNKHPAKPFWRNNDAWVAVSLDNGVTWRRTNLSNSSDKTVAVGDNPYADVKRIAGAVESNMALVTWLSTYCPNNNPMNLAPVTGNADANPPVPAADLATMPPADISNPAVYNTYDIYNVAGAQGAVNYADPANGAMMYRPEIGKVAYHCLWVARGVLDSGTAQMNWYAAEQITSGVRDANLDMAAAAISPDESKGAFAVVWQEDPMGLSPGQGAGEGVGWGGPETSNGSDIWYTSIDMACFAQTGSAAAVSGCYAANRNSTVNDGRPAPAYRMSAPVPVSDNNNCTLGTSGWNAPYCEPLATAFGTMLQTKKGTKNSGTVTFARDGQKNPMCAVKNINLSPYWTDPNWPAAMGTLEQQCDNFDSAVNSVPLDGDAAAARSKLHLVYDEHIDGIRALLTYEEKKALGFLCKNDSTCQAERLDYQGKFVMFHSFAANHPNTINAGGILNVLTSNYMDTNQDGIGDTVRVTSTGVQFRYIFENARNARIFAQDANNAAYRNGQVGSRDLRMAVVYKYGLFNMSQTSDLMLRRACGGYQYEDWGSCAAAEAAVKGVDRDPICISCETVTRAEPGSVKDHTECSACHSAGSSVTSSDSAISAKALDWSFVYKGLADNNLYMDPAAGISKSVSSYDPLDDVDAPWVALAGDMILVSYTQAANWPSSHHYMATSDFLVRRSFDSGFSWTNANRTQNVGPVNISNLPDSEITEESRVLVPEDCGFDAGTGVFACPDAYDTIHQVNTIPILATYCTAANVPISVPDSELGEPVDPQLLNCYSALSSDLGETYLNARDISGDGSDIALVAANHEGGTGPGMCNGNGSVAGSWIPYCAGEAGFDWFAHGANTLLDVSVTLVPSLTPGYTDRLQSVWLQEGAITDRTPYNGIDAWYRYVDLKIK